MKTTSNKSGQQSYLQLVGEQKFFLSDKVQIGKYSQGIVVKVNKKLKSITVKVHGTTAQRYYVWDGSASYTNSRDKIYAISLVQKGQYHELHDKMKAMAKVPGIGLVPDLTHLDDEHVHDCYRREYTAEQLSTVGRRRLYKGDEVTFKNNVQIKGTVVDIIPSSRTAVIRIGNALKPIFVIWDGAYSTFDSKCGVYNVIVTKAGLDAIQANKQLSIHTGLTKTKNYEDIKDKIREVLNAEPADEFSKLPWVAKPSRQKTVTYVEVKRAFDRVTLEKGISHFYLFERLMEELGITKN